MLANQVNQLKLTLLRLYKLSNYFKTIRKNCYLIYTKNIYQSFKTKLVDIKTIYGAPRQMPWSQGYAPLGRTSSTRGPIHPRTSPWYSWYWDRSKTKILHKAFYRYKLIKPIKHLLIIAITLIVISTTVYASDSSQIKTLSGNTQTLVDLLKKIDKYTPNIEESKLDLTNITLSEINNDYIEKPQILKTAKRYTYNNSSYLSRDVITRDSKRLNDSDNTAYIVNDRKTNTYWRGFCTWYAKEMRPDIPNNWGNAKNWLNSAQRSGWETGLEPQAGAIIVTTESWAGHVGYVESVNSDQITISEMNKVGWNRITRRTLDKNSKIIKGFIY